MSDSSPQTVASEGVTAASEGLAKAAHRAAAADHAPVSLTQSEFLSAIVHELRNPMSALAYAIDVLESDVGAKKRERIYRMMRRQLEQLEHVMRDITDSTVACDSLLKVERTPVDIQSITRESIEAVTGRCAERGHRLDLKMDLGAEDLWGDHRRLVQVVTNLLDNAIKYTPPGGQIDVVVQRRDPHEVNLSIRDTGLGMSEEMQARAFDLFARCAGASQCATDRPSGLGIGLFLVRQIVELHDGQLEVHSDGQGQGCVFDVTLPLGRPASLDQAPFLVSSAP